MFNAEVYDNILRFLSRDDLDNVQLVSRYSDSAVESIPTDHMPRRVLHRLFVHGHNTYFVDRDEGSGRLPILSENDLAARMKFALVKCLRFEPGRMDELLLNTLLLYKDAWKVARCEVGFAMTSYTFASAEVCERFFNELLLCQMLYVGHACKMALESPLMASAAVQHCRSFLLRTGDDIVLNFDDLVAWLHRDHAWIQPLELLLSARNVDLPPFLVALKEVFGRSKQSHHYSVQVHNPERIEIQEEVLYNENTCESLGISMGSWGHIIVKRVPFEKE